MNRKGIASFLMIAAMLILPLSAPAVSASTVLFSANFNGLKNGSQAPGWTPYGNVFVQNNEYEIPCVSNGCTPANGSAWSTALYTNQAFGNFNYSVRDTGLGQCGPPSLPQLPPVLTIVFRAQSSSKQPSLNTYYAWMDIDKLQISKYVNGVPTVMGTVTLASLKEQGLLSASNDTVTITHNGEQETTFNPTGTYYLEISAYGSTLSMFFKGHLELQVTDSTYASGYIGFGTYACNGSFTDVLVTQIPSVPSVELTTLLNLYNSRPDLQSAFPEVSEGIYTNLVNWAHGVVTQQWVDGSYDTLAPYGYWYTLMYTYNTSPDLQGAFPDPYFSVSSYQGLINWAGGVVTQKWSDGRYSTLQPFGYWYDLMMVYNQRSDLQTAFPTCTILNLNIRV